MTLNITLLTPTIIYQSADYRLWNPDANIVLTDTSTKIVTSETFEWQSFVTYTGVGQWEWRDTSEWVVEWLTGLSGHSFMDMVERIREKGSEWLQGIRRETGTAWQQTFVAASFVDGTATAAVISNFWRSTGPALSTPLDHLNVSTVQAPLKPQVIVTGCVDKVVSRQQRRGLERLASASGDNPARIRHAMIDLNLAAAQVKSTRCPISKECSVHSFTRDGRWSHGETPTGARLYSVFEGIDIGSMLNEVLEQHFPGSKYRTVQGASGSSRTRRADDPPCQPVLSSLSEMEGYTLIDAAPARDHTGVAQAVDIHQRAVGQGGVGAEPPTQPAMWTSPGEMKFLETLGGLEGRAFDLNDQGISVGVVEDAERALRACTWSENGRLTLLTPERFRSSQARAINAQGDIAGWVSVHATHHGREYHRPALWHSDGRAQVLHECPGDWGEAIALNDIGQVLIWAHEGRTSFPVLWNGHDWQALARPPTYVLPVGLDAEGGVIGLTKTQDGLPLALVWEQGNNWTRLGTDPGWEVTAVNGSGFILGHGMIDGFHRPWIMQIGEELQILPHYAYHHSRPSSMNGAGLIAGTASTDHGYHPVIWRPTEC
jgi:hypothetical protein